MERLQGCGKRSRGGRAGGILAAVKRRRPPALPAPVTTVAAALGRGLTPTDLQSTQLDRSVWGVRATTRAATLEARCRLFTARLPSAFFSHETAAELLGMPLPAATRDLLDMASVAPERAPHARGIRGHSLAVTDDDVIDVRGLRVTSPARTWFDLGARLPVPDLVAIGDGMVARLGPQAAREPMRALLERSAGQRGTRRLATALALLNGRAESPQESRLRAMLLCGGLPEPAVNQDVFDSAGRFLARGDLVYPAERLVIEYQGDYHREKSQWRQDMTRRSRLEAAGWRVLELNADDLRAPNVLVARVRALLGAMPLMPPRELP